MIKPRIIEEPESDHRQVIARSEFGPEGKEIPIVITAGSRFIVEFELPERKNVYVEYPTDEIVRDAYEFVYPELEK